MVCTARAEAACQRAGADGLAVFSMSMGNGGGLKRSGYRRDDIYGWIADYCHGVGEGNLVV